MRNRRGTLLRWATDQGLGYDALSAVCLARAKSFVADVQTAKHLPEIVCLTGRAAALESLSRKLRVGRDVSTRDLTQLECLLQGSHLSMSAMSNDHDRSEAAGVAS